MSGHFEGFSKSYAGQFSLKFGGPGETRTPTPVKILDFESSASTNSTTGPTRLEIEGFNSPKTVGQEVFSRLVQLIVTFGLYRKFGYFLGITKNPQRLVG